MTAAPLIPEPDPKAFPARYRDWEHAGAFAPTATGRPFTMLLPPPNITGSLHMGHALEHTLSDARARLERLRGRSLRWIPGLDHAGIATQTLIESHLAAEGLTRHELGREEFLARCWEWKDETAARICAQMRALGTSPHWEELAFTLDPVRQRATQEAFRRCFDAGLIYRARRLTPWCPRCATALADIETEESPEGSRCTRCRTLTEPRETLQWFLRTSSLAAAAAAAPSSGLEITPSSAASEWAEWCERMHDWCLSRQLWWGHRIPIWYDEDGEAHCLGPDDEPLPTWTQDEDTLDTWFSSALWPLTALGWPDPDPRLAAGYPQELLITGSDLIFFWAIRMHMLCTFLTGTPPFTHLALHGMIRDSAGRKMSKSRGNTIDPLPLIDEHGPDALRLALARTTRPGLDASFQDSDLTFARHLLRKLWSLTAFTAAHPPGAPSGPSPHLLDRWLRSALGEACAAITTGIESCDLAGATAALHQLITEDCSRRYLEAAKTRLRAPGRDGEYARATLRSTLEAALTLMHPLAPFTTDALATSLELDLLTTRWPAPPAPDPAATAAADTLNAALTSLRQFRADRGIEPATPLPARLTGLALADELAELGHLSPLGGHDPSTLSLLAAPGFEIALDASGRWDRDRIRTRLDRALARAAAHRARLEAPEFQTRAPERVQHETREALREACEDAARAERALTGA